MVELDYNQAEGERLGSRDWAAYMVAYLTEVEVEEGYN